jgi:hypothetical protein
MEPTGMKKCKHRVSSTSQVQGMFVEVSGCKVHMLEAWLPSEIWYRACVGCMSAGWYTDAGCQYQQPGYGRLLVVAVVLECLLTSAIPRPVLPHPPSLAVAGLATNPKGLSFRLQDTECEDTSAFANGLRTR